MSLGFSSGMPPFDNETLPMLFTTVWRAGVKGELKTKWYEGIVSHDISTSFNCLFTKIKKGMPRFRSVVYRNAQCIHGFKAHGG